LTQQSTWFVELTGDRQDLRDIAQRGLSAGLHIVDPDAKAILDIPNFDRSADPSVVFRAAEEEVRILNGLGWVFLRNWRGFEVAGLRSREPGKPPTSFILPKGIPSGERFGVAGASVPGEPPDRRVSSPVERAYSLSRSDEDIRKLLRLLGTDPLDYRQLYVVYEVVEIACQGIDGVLKLRVASKAQLRQFKQTANSVAALQDESQHGRESTEPPDNPMPLEEAEVLIRELASVWINEKAG
jgi:hypothetical protein